MYIIKFERNAKSGLKAKILLENDNEHLKLKINPTEVTDGQEEEKKEAAPKVIDSQGIEESKSLGYSGSGQSKSK